MSEKALLAEVAPSSWTATTSCTVPAGPGRPPPDLLSAAARRSPGRRAAIVARRPPDPGGRCAGDRTEPRGAPPAGSRPTIIVIIVDRRSYTDRARTIAVTDDRALTERVRHLGAAPGD
jgi:hypothetical protein